MVTKDGGRGQMIVLGCILIAVVVVGISIVINSVVYTANSPHGGSNDQLSEAREIDYETQKAVRSIMLRINHRSEWDASGTDNDLIGTTPTNLPDDAQQNVEDRFGTAYAQSFASTGPTSVDVTYSGSTPGSRIIQAADGRLVSDVAGQPQWQPIVTEQEVGWFTLNVDVPTSRTAYLETNGNERVPFTLVFTDRTGGQLTLIVTPVENGGDLQLEVRSELTNDPTGSTDSRTGICDPENERVLLDLEAGNSVGNDCEFFGLDDLDENIVTAQIEDGDNLAGKYEFVTDGTPDFGTGGGGTTYPNCYDKTASASDKNTPCETPVVWSSTVSVAVQSSDVTYSNTFTVETYP